MTTLLLDVHKRRGDFRHRGDFASMESMRTLAGREWRSEEYLREQVQEYVREARRNMAELTRYLRRRTEDVHPAALAAATRALQDVNMRLVNALHTFELADQQREAPPPLAPAS